MTISNRGPMKSQNSKNTSRQLRPSPAGCFCAITGRHASLYKIVYSGPQQTSIGYPEPSTIRKQVLRACGHCSRGPSGVVDQSSARIHAAISPSPAKTDSINCVLLGSIAESLDSSAPFDKGYGP